MAVEDRECYVYRLAAIDGTLLYVGVADDPGRRLHQHYKQKPWWREIAHVDLERFATRQEALSAERHAILTEKPRYNVVHNADNLGRDGMIRWFCKACGQEIAADGKIIMEVGRARDHLRSYVAGVSMWECPESGMVDPYHDACSPYSNLEAREPDGRASYYYWQTTELRTTRQVLMWCVQVCQYPEAGGTYVAYLLEQVLGVADVVEA